MFPIRDVNPTRVFPVVTLAVIAVNVLVYFLWQPHGGGEEVEFLYERAAIACELTTREPLTIGEIEFEQCVGGGGRGPEVFPEKRVTVAAFVSMFLHGGLLHLLGNMWFLWIFGNNVEEAYGRLKYLAMYLLAGAAATALFVAKNPDNTTPLIGASGAIAGVLGSYVVLFPRHLVISIVFFFLLPIPALVFLGFWFLGQFAINDPGVAWEAHVAGFVFGMAVTALFRSPLSARVRALHGGRMRWAD